MNIESIVYDDGEISVALVKARNETTNLNMAMKWLEPKPSYKHGREIQSSNVMGGETEWFILPGTFAGAIGKVLVELKVTGMPYFNEDGFSLLVQWLVEYEYLNDAMCC